MSKATVAPGLGDGRRQLEAWLYPGERGVRDSTRLSYRQHLDDYLVPALGRYRLADSNAGPS